MKSSPFNLLSLSHGLLIALFFIFHFIPSNLAAEAIDSPCEIVSADENAVATLLTLPCGGQVIQITNSQPGLNGGGTATQETRTVYSFAPDNANGIPTYLGGAWPYVMVSEAPIVDESISAEFAVNEDGVLLINGWPAYQFVGDGNETDANGVYGAWFYFLSDGNPSGDACIEVFDCPDLSANIGDSCDDGDPNTEDDTIQEDCSCLGQELTLASIYTLVNWNASCGDRATHIALYEVGTTSLIYETETFINDNGFAELVGIVPGNYDVIQKVEGFLAVGTSNLSLAPGENTFTFGDLTPGDFNDSNGISISDFSLLTLAFGSISTDSNYNPYVDSNCNGVINISDISTVVGNFGMVGVSAPL